MGPGTARRSRKAAAMWCSSPCVAGASPGRVALGERIFQGEAAGGTCAGCHGTDGKGTAMGSDLTSGKWLWGNGSVRAITQTIAQGVAKPKAHTG